MQDQAKKYLIIIFILAGACGATVSIQAGFRQPTCKVEFSKLPYAFENWTGFDIPVDKDVKDILGTGDVIMRLYKDVEGTPIVVAIVYSSSNRDAIHPPEICYLGSGVALLDQTREFFVLPGQKKLEANYLVLRSSQSITTAWYWFLAGDRFIPGYYSQQLRYLWYAIRGRPFPTALIRISVEGDTPYARERARNFIEEFYPYIKSLLLG